MRSTSVIAEHAAVYGKRGVQGIETGRDLHALGFADGLAVGHVYPRLFKGRAAVRESILYDEVLRLLCVHERSQRSAAAVEAYTHVLNAAVAQQLLDLLRGAGSDLVYHRPREGDFLFVGKPVDESFRNEALFLPDLRHGQYVAAQQLTVVRAVIHAHHGDGVRPGLVALQQQLCRFAHGVAAAAGAVVHIGLRGGEILAVHVLYGVALLGYRKAEQLEGRLAENLPKPVHISAPGLGRERLCNGRHSLLLYAAVGQQADCNAHTVIGLEYQLDAFLIGGDSRDDPALFKSVIEQPVLYSRDEAAENVAGAEVNPDGCSSGIKAHLRMVKAGYFNAGFFPCRAILRAFVTELHYLSAPFAALHIASQRPLR